MTDENTVTIRSIRLLWAAIIVLALGLAAVVLLRQQQAPASATNATVDEAQMHAAVRDYILQNPEILQEAASKLRAQQQQADEAAAKEQISANRDALFRDGTSVAVGDGAVNVVEFFDYNCPYCRRSQPAMKKLLEKDNVRFVFKEFPILGPDSVFAAKAAIASINQGEDKYLDFHNAMMANEGRIDEDAVLTIAREVGLDVDRLQADMQKPEVQDTIDRNIALARTVGVSGTPAFIIGDTLVPGAAEFSYLEELVDEADQS